MASVNFMKLKGVTHAKAIFKHCATDTRLESEHSNKQINKAMTHQNLYIITETYKELCERFDSRLAEIEKTNKNKRKDRVDCFALAIPIPDGVDTTQTVEYVTKVVNLVSNQYGNANVLGGFVHADERHDYIDAETGDERTSLRHIHLFVTPEVDGSLNGKEFSKKANMTKLNKSIDEMTRNDYNCQFMTGSKHKSKKSVERLKSESEEFLNDRINEVEELKRQLLQTIAEYSNKSPNDDFYEWAKGLKSKGMTLEERYKAFKASKTEEVKKSTNDTVESRLKGVKRVKTRNELNSATDDLESRLEANKEFGSINDVLRHFGMDSV